jgi:hypothetical protein
MKPIGSETGKTVGAAEVVPVVTVAQKLQELGVEESLIAKIEADIGVTSVDDLAELTEADLIGIGMKKMPARRLVIALASTDSKTNAASAPVSAVGTVSFDSVLPAVPNDASWLEGLKAGGVLKVEQSTVISAIRAALAHKVGLYGIPETLVKLMEAFADENEEKVDPEFFKLRKMLTRRSYAEIFEAIEGLDGNYVTEARKKQFFSRIDEHMWPAIIEFYTRLREWYDAWSKGANNPMFMMTAIMSMGGAPGVMPPGIMQPPETGVLRDTADGLADKVNKVFAGTGVQIAAALAYDANKIKETLENPRLPALIGATNRDQMLRKLEVAVSATYPRLEINLTRFVLSVMQLKDQPAGNEELQYLGALYMLGSQIPWEQLDIGGGRRLSGIGGRGERI